MPRVVPIDISQYVELRTMLDSVEAGSLRLYLDPLEFEKQKENYEFLKHHLMIISDHVWHREKKVKTGKKHIDEGPCPDGYFNCGGCCVPYECVLSDPKPY